MNKNKKKILKTLIYISCIVFIFIAIINMLITSQAWHLSNCNVPECCRCLLINNAIYFLENILGIIKIIIFNIIMPLIYIIISQKMLIHNKTLVLLKVRLNE